MDVYLRVPGLGCGAVEGLGCGSRIIPLLVHLAGVDGVRHAATDRSGTLLRVELRADASVDAIEVALAAYGYSNHRELRPTAGRMLWYDADGARELSRIEAGTVAERLATALANAGRLADAERPAFLAAAAVGLFEAFVTTPILPGRPSTVATAAARNVRQRVAAVLGDSLAELAERSIAL